MIVVYTNDPRVTPFNLATLLSNMDAALEERDGALVLVKDGAAYAPADLPGLELHISELDAPESDAARARAAGWDVTYHRRDEPDADLTPLGLSPDGLRAWRLAKGWSQTRLAAALGTTQNTVSRWETAATGIEHPALLSLALEALDARLNRSPR